MEVLEGGIPASDTHNDITALNSLSEEEKEGRGEEGEEEGRRSSKEKNLSQNKTSSSR